MGGGKGKGEERLKEEREEKIREEREKVIRDVEMGLKVPERAHLGAEKLE